MTVLVAQNEAGPTFCFAMTTKISKCNFARSYTPILKVFCRKKQSSNLGPVSEELGVLVAMK